MALTPDAAAAQGGEDRSRHARRIEVDHYYAWKTRQRRDQYGETNRSLLMTRVRMRELERLFRSRWGYTLPADDAGRDDLTIAAHHIAHFGGDVRRHIVAWAEVWAPWFPKTSAEALAAEVIKRPLKWTADTLGWRLQLTDVERTALGITTIGAIDMGKAEREAARKERKREAARERRRRKAIAAGRVPGTNGRPQKNPYPAVVDFIAGYGFSARGRTPPRGASTLPQAGGATVPAALEAPPADLTAQATEMAEDATVGSADAIGVLRQWWPHDLEGRVKAIRLYEKGRRGDGAICAGSASARLPASSQYGRCKRAPIYLAAG